MNDIITDISFMRNLKVLHAYGNCGINQNGINGLDLVKLYADDNKKITTKSFKKS